MLRTKTIKGNTGLFSWNTLLKVKNCACGTTKFCSLHALFAEYFLTDDHFQYGHIVVKLKIQQTQLQIN